MDTNDEGRVLRYDAGELLKSYRTAEGYILAEGRAIRPGILTYRRADGSVRRELIPPEELFKADSLATLGRKPVTLEHPPLDESGAPIWLSPDNVSVLAVGDVDGEIVEDAGGFVKLRIAVRRKDAIEAIEAGKRGLSPGYTCRYDPTPGIWQGQPYDGVQRDRRYNHLAICSAGRGGPEVRLRLDSADAVQVDSSAAAERTEERMGQASIDLGGVRYDVDAGTAQAIQGAIEAARLDGGKTYKEQLDALKKSYDAKCGEAASMDAELKSLKDQMAEVEAKMKEKEAKNGSGGAGEKEPEKKGDADDDFLKRFAARLSLLRTAEAVGVERADAMPDDEIRRAIVAADNPELKLDSLSADFLDGYVARVAAQSKKAAASSAAAAAATLPAQRTDAKPEEPKTAAERLAKIRREAVEAMNSESQGAIA